MAQVSQKSQEAIIEYSKFVMTEQSQDSYYDKMEAIDVAYARYITNVDPKTGLPHGEGIDAATAPTGVFNVPSTTPPVIVSQVESMVGYLSEVFLSGTPLFPVVSSPANREDAGALEALLDDHSILGGYPRELLIFLRDAVKYNLAAVETDWSSVDQYDVMDELITPEQPQLKRRKQYFTKLQRLDMYNTVWDRNTVPGDIAKDGDYAGHVKILSRTKLKRLLNKLSVDGDAMNVEAALASYIQADAPYYRIHPQISDYISARKPESIIDWGSFLGIESSANKKSLLGNYELLTLYARLCPSDLGISAPMKNTPQVFKLMIVNGTVVICAKRIISAYDLLPILFAQPFEDGMGYQTKSIAEGSIPIQEAAKTLFAIKFNTARRAVSDRALYNPSVINPRDVNAPVPAAKIPVNANSLNARPISDFYYPIPFDGRGTESALQDGMQIVGFGKELSGLNSPMQGQFQKGNKSVVEWRDTMGGADARLRLPALSLEYQFFVPLKEILKFNIWQYGQDVAVVSQKTGDVLTVDITKLRKSVLSFRVADGYTPKSKIAGTDSIIQIMQMISQSPILQQQYGTMLPGIVDHLAQLLGIRGLNEYLPQQQPTIPAQEMQASGTGADFISGMQKRDLTQQELALREQANQLRGQELAQR
jgi:hypothetical protein